MRKNPKLSGTTHNVFGIQVGVSINLFVRKVRGRDQQKMATEAPTGDQIIKAKIHYANVDEYLRKEQKYAYLEEKQHVGNIEWHKLLPDKKETG